jgi:nucleoside-diphosphate-sugar epimerase
MKILILGANGFIGSHLTARVLKDTDWQVFGLDLDCDRLDGVLKNPRFHFLEGDITINHEWIEYHIKKCDVCLPLVAYATPAKYIQDPLSVFKLDFEENLHIVRQCEHYKRRVIFPSTSEVYGMCPDAAFSEDNSPLVYGPICKQRWIYASSKQLLDRVIWAMGKHSGLQFTLIRPFNWIGIGLDNIAIPKEGSSRVVTQFLGHIFRGESIALVNGGKQRRCFTFIDDGVEALMRIIQNKDGCCDGQIFNIGNPKNDYSVRELAEMMIQVAQTFPELSERARNTKLEEVSSKNYYGNDYEDMNFRVPDITKARTILGWEPKIPLREALQQITGYYIQKALPEIDKDLGLVAVKE